MRADKKAKELVDKFYHVENPISDNSIRAMDWIDAKYCALIAVDEILVNIEATKIYHKESVALPINEQYWNEVKTEIEKL